MNRTPIKRKRAPKLSEEKILEAFEQYQNGSSLRDLGRLYGVSYETLRQHFNDRKGDVVRSIVARKFKDKSFDEFCDYVRLGMSPEVAAGMLGCTPQAFNELLEKDIDFANAVMAARYEHLGNAETTIAKEARENWRAALDVITRAPETRDKWKSGDSKDTNIVIPVQVNFVRED